MSVQPGIEILLGRLEMFVEVRADHFADFWRLKLFAAVASTGDDVKC